MRTRLLYFTSLGMEVPVVDLSSDSEGEVSPRSPDHRRPCRQLGGDPKCGGGDTGSSAMDIVFEQAGAAWPSDAIKKGKEKVVEGESAKHSGESLGAAGRVLGAGTGSDPWSALMSKCKAGEGGNNGAGCWGTWGDQLHSHSDSAASSDRWKGILGARPADPVNPLWRSLDTAMKDNEDETFSQKSVAAREINSCDDFLMEDSSSSWLSRIEGLHFPLPDEHQLRATQIENDEAFARRLQEQLNQEQPGSQHSQAVVDTTIAWTLHEQDAEHARFAAREGQSSSSQRDRSMAHLYSYGRHSPVQSFASSASNRIPIPMPSRRSLQIDANRPQVERLKTLINQLTKGCYGGKYMDLEERFAVLDSLCEELRKCEEDTVYPDYDDDDYENQIAFDVDIQPRGASDDQINSLPLSLVEGESDEPCNICLDCPSAGDSIRHLPCFHKFHKQCIDRWLGIRMWCPVCKLNAFSQ